MNSLSGFLFLVLFYLISFYGNRTALELLVQRLEHDEECRHDKQQSYSTDTHTADDTKGEGAVTVGSGTSLNDQRYHTDNHRCHGHQNRTQTLLTCLEGCIDNAQPLCTALCSELGNQDGSLRLQTDEHDDTCLQVDIVIHTRYFISIAQVSEHEGTHQSERHAEQHGPWCEP